MEHKPTKQDKPRDVGYMFIGPDGDLFGAQAAVIETLKAAPSSEQLTLFWNLVTDGKIERLG
jgi:hypothetical protein